MHRPTLAELAFYQIRDEAAAWCVSEEGRSAFARREPLTDAAEIGQLKSYGKAWTDILHGADTAPLPPWQPVSAALSFAQADGATLELEQLSAIAGFCRSTQKTCETVRAASRSLDIACLCALTAEIPLAGVDEAAAKIARVIDRNGQLKDLPELRTIRAAIASLQAEIAAAFKAYTSDTTLAPVLESTVPVYRAGRQLLAVRASHKNRIHGIVHEASQTGQTLYVEPETVVRKNNELTQETFRLQAAIRKILTELTADLRGLIPALRAALTTMTLLDTTLAAARWGMENRCAFALDCNGQPPLLLQARHPLLRANAVPIDIHFMEGKRVLIITGPNTGGKTVTLKTFALLCLLNQAGLPVPAAEGTRLPLFGAVFADIGDDQSIERSLSTFSAHMKHLAAACAHADQHSLVLLDELGSGTDPQEGGAIAMAVLDALLQKDAFILVTTHHGILKNYGYTHPQCVNASVDFDTDTLAPTYRLHMGIPGESHALDIARRSGLPAAVVEKAASYLTGNQADVSALIQGLTQRHAELAEQEKAARAAQDAIAQKLLKLEQRELKLRQKETELMRREQKDESDFLRHARKRLENVVRELREGEITREKTLAVKRHIADLTDATAARQSALEQTEAQLETDAAALNQRVATAATVVAENGMRITTTNGTHTGSKKKTKRRLSNAEAFARAAVPACQNDGTNRRQDSAAQAAPYAEGAEVLITATNMRGTLVRQEKDGTWLVQIGSLRMPLRQKDFMPVAPAPQAKPTMSVELAPGNGNAGIAPGGAAAKPVFELRLLGMRAEEAIRLLERQLDLCAMQNFRTFSVIHGKGTGVLQQAVQDYLSAYPGVQEFHFARPEDGGTGKTYVTLA